MDKEIEKETAQKSYNITNINLVLGEKERIIKDLKLKRAQLEKEIKEHDEQFLQSSRGIQSLIDEKNEQIARALAKIEELKESSVVVQGQLQDSYQHQMSDLGKTLDSEIHQKEHEMDKLSHDIKVITNFKNTRRQNQDALDQEIFRYNDLCAELERVKTEGDRDLLSLSKRIDDNFEKQIKEYQKKAQSDAERNISEIERNIQLQNHVLEDHAELQADEIDHTEAVADKLVGENQQYQEDLRSKEAAVEEFARKQYEQNNKIRMLKSKIELLEKKLAEIVANFEKEKELLRFQSEQVIKEQAEETRGLRESIRLKTREVKNLKALCQMILDQRSDIEQFFLEALEQVKEETRRKLVALEAQNHQTSPQQHFLPLIDPKSKFSKQNAFEKQQQSQTQDNNKQNGGNGSSPMEVALAKLDWEDRERVLRLMFSKMNSGQPPSNWRMIDNGGAPTSQGRGTSGAATSGRGGDLNRSFRERNGDEEDEEDDDGYDQEIDEDNEGGEDEDDDNN